MAALMGYFDIHHKNAGQIWGAWPQVVAPYAINRKLHSSSSAFFTNTQ